MSGAAFCGSSSLLSDAGCGGGSAKRSSMMVSFSSFERVGSRFSGATALRCRESIYC